MYPRPLLSETFRVNLQNASMSFALDTLLSLIRKSCLRQTLYVEGASYIAIEAPFSMFSLFEVVNYLTTRLFVLITQINKAKFCFEYVQKNCNRIIQIN